MQPQVEPVLNALRSEIRHLKCFVAQLSAKNEMLSLQLKQQERHSEKRRREVASLHQACAKYKRARVECAQRRRRSFETKTATNSPTPTSPPPQPLPPPPPPNNDDEDATPGVSLQTHTFKQAFDICFRECARQRRPTFIAGEPGNLATLFERDELSSKTLEAQYDETLNAALQENHHDFQIGRRKFFRLIDEERMLEEAAHERRFENMHLDRSIDEHMLMFRRRMNGSADAG